MSDPGALPEEVHRSSPRTTKNIIVDGVASRTTICFGGKVRGCSAWSICTSAWLESLWKSGQLVMSGRLTSIMSCVPIWEGRSRMKRTSSADWLDESTNL